MPNFQSPDQIIRPEILALSAYHVPPATGMIKLDAMENPYPLPAVLREEIAQLTATVPVNRYPDASAASLKAALRQALAISDEMDILLGNGSDEIIQIIAMAAAKPGAVLMSVEPAFVMFRMIATFANMPYVGVPLKKDFSLDLEAMLAAIEKHKPAVIFLAYPNNPTGNLFDANAILTIIRATSGIVIVDEAYHAFADASMINQLTQYPNLLLMRTLSKLGLAGLRLGLLIGRSEWLTQLEKVRLPYNVGIMTQLIAEKVLHHTDVLLEQAEAIKAERTKVRQYLDTIDGLEVFPSDANFILFRVHTASKIFQALKQHRILIKNLDGTHPLLENCLRVTVGTPDENSQFCEILRTILSKTV
ncbi:MAG TPA: histidinol-phosphate transaminase [Nitrosomonas sp.]|jgi:histidinol-phosphate aminotransferase|nr:histidinol-phosphate transaminase [Nitrosomonas sp.]MBP7111777.1 histidinol-phosphate transaminase [Nitrosomonas sp.]MBP9870514.1 histidinol-phosphate transaminase [Nitrosomonas sp.]HQV88054.1 histidinol-phosphate transaminase [Nitrosomonas sp.]HRB97630.1 histidinol-phosphate transaminase [Nitrosomonas sp.]